MYSEQLLPSVWNVPKAKKINGIDDSILAVENPLTGFSEEDLTCPSEFKNLLQKMVVYISLLSNAKYQDTEGYVIACRHRRDISGRPFSDPLHSKSNSRVERSDDRKYVCFRWLGK